MSEIALYESLRKIDGVSPEEAKEAADSVASAKEVATKADVANLKAEIFKQLYVVTGIIIAGVSLLNAIVALAIKYL